MHIDYARAVLLLVLLLVLVLLLLLLLLVLIGVVAYDADPSPAAAAAAAAAIVAVVTQAQAPHVRMWAACMHLDYSQVGAVFAQKGQAPDKEKQGNKGMVSNTVGRVTNGSNGECCCWKSWISTVAARVRCGISGAQHAQDGVPLYYRYRMVSPCSLVRWQHSQQHQQHACCRVCCFCAVHVESYLEHLPRMGLAPLLPLPVTLTLHYLTASDESS